VSELDTSDRALLDQLQSAFPLVPQPYAALGDALGLDEQDVLERVRRLRQEKVIRQIGAIFDTRRLGYHSTLVAFHVPDDAMEAVAATISAHPGVSHNYARPHHYNLWFTLAVPPDRDVSSEIGRLARQTGTEDWLDLPALRTFKLQTHFGLGQARSQHGQAAIRAKRPSRPLSPDDIPFVRELQKDLPDVPRPFAGAAARLQLGEEDLLAKARELAEAGIMRRFSGVLYHRRVGYTANGMACWVVSEEQIEEIGTRAAAYPQVSHCYQRPSYPPRWPYTLFTMIHGRKEREVNAVAGQIAREIAVDTYQVLYSTREFKKERVRYFVEPRSEQDAEPLPGGEQA
jgi:DNA-binding Lrp family transcriptional regulator